MFNKICSGISNFLPFYNIFKVNLKKDEYNKAQFLHVTVPCHLSMNNISVEGIVESKSGNIQAVGCTIKAVIAPKNIFLINSSAESLFAKKVLVKQSDKTSSVIGKIWSWGNVELDRVCLADKIKSCYGSIMASHSTLQDIFAEQNITLTNSSATHIIANRGKITIKQLDGMRRTFTSVLSMHEQVIADRCDIKKFVSSKQKAIVTNSSIQEGLSLMVNPRHLGVLDLTNTQVNGPIDIRIGDPIQFVGAPALGAFPRKCSLLIKGGVDLEKIKFTWDLPYKLSYQKTIDGILIKGTLQST